MKVGILQTGRAPDELVVAHGDYNEMFMQLLAGPDISFTTFRVLDDEFPIDETDADAWIVTGSRCGVYDGFAWITRLEDWLRHAIARRAPIAGICFGHQVIAQALGATVEKSEAGWQVGLKTYSRTDGSLLTLPAWHQDQIISPAAGARLLASAPGCRYAAFDYGSSVRTYQAHPEFTNDYLRGLFDVRGDLLGKDIVEAGLASLDHGAPDNIAAEITGFLAETAAARG